MSIDHEAAKSVCHARLAQDMHPSSSDRNIARAYLDLHAQLEAKDRRIEALADLVELSFTVGRTAGMNYYELGKDVPGFSFYESELPSALDRLTAIKEGRDHE